MLSEPYVYILCNGKLLTLVKVQPSWSHHWHKADSAYYQVQMLQTTNYPVIAWQVKTRLRVNKQLIEEITLLKLQSLPQVDELLQKQEQSYHLYQVYHLQCSGRRKAGVQKFAKVLPLQKSKAKSVITKSCLDLIVCCLVFPTTWALGNSLGFPYWCSQIGIFYILDWTCWGHRNRLCRYGQRITYTKNEITQFAPLM